MAVNPHAETYQGKTQFSGPVKAGSRWDAVPDYDRLTVPGTIQPTDLPNAGYVVCSQSAAVDQTTSKTITNIMLPSGSMILSVQFIVTTPYTTATTAWTASQTWSVDDVVLGKAGGADENVRFKCTTGGAGATSGTGPLGDPGDEDIADNVARWRYHNLSKALTLFADPAGSTAAGTYLCPKPNQGGTLVDAVGVYNVGPSLYSTEEYVWRNISDPTYMDGAQSGVSLDVRKYSAEDGDGRAIVTINYIPEFNYGGIF